MSLLSGLPKPTRRALQWDAISATLSGFFNGALFPFLGVIARSELHASSFMLACLNASGSIGNLLNPVMAHHIRDRRKLPYVVWPFAIGRLFFLLMPLAFIAPVFIAISFIANATLALAAPGYAAIIRDAYPVERRGQLMGWVRVIFVGMSMLGSLVGGFLLIKHGNYRWAFPLVTILGLASAAAFARVGVQAEPDCDTPIVKSRLLDAFHAAKHDKAFKLYATCFYLYGFGNLIMGPVVPVFQVDQLHITAQWVGYLATASAAASVLGYLYWGKILDRFGPFRLMLFVVSILSITGITYALARSVPVLLIASAAQGLAFSGGDLGYASAAMRFGKRDSAAAYAGTWAFLQACRGIPGPFLGAFLLNQVGPRPVFLLSLCCWAASASVIIFGGGLRLKPCEEE